MNIEKIKILSNKFQIIQKFQLPNVSGSFILPKFLDISYTKHFKISEIFWTFDVEVFGKEIF